MENTPLLSIGEMITDALRREIAAQIAVAFDVRPSCHLTAVKLPNYSKYLYQHSRNALTMV